MTRPVASPEPLVCPSCARTFPLDERFCPDCKMPLVYAGFTGVDHPITDVGERARKIKRQYSEGDLVRVAGARNQAEAEFIQGMLLEEGIPSVQRRSRGFDVPDFLAAGPRDVLVPQSGAMAAREVLLEAEIVPAYAQGSSAPAPGPLALALLGLVVLIALVAWLGTEVIG
jgi:uncharacterized protein YbaR (Trm112 family)